MRVAALKLTLLYLVVLLFGCSKVVKHESLSKEKKFTLDCMSVLPIEGKEKDLDIRDDLRKAIHSQLSISGIKLTPIQQVDSALELYARELNPKLRNLNLSKTVNCKYILSGKLTNNSNLNLVVLTDFRISANFEIHDALNDIMLWNASYDSASSNGGIPLDPVRLAEATYSAQVNNNEDHKQMLIFDFAKKIVKTIPNLKYSPLTDTFSYENEKPVFVTIEPTTQSGIQDDPEVRVRDLVNKLDKTPKSDFKKRLAYLSELKTLRSKDHWLLYENARLNYLLGNYLESQQDINESIHILEQSNKSDMAYFYLASRVAMARNDRLTLLPLLEKFSAQNMGANFDNELMHLYMDLGRYKQALNLIKKIVKKSSKDDGLALNQFICEAQLNMKSEASKDGALLLKKAIRERDQNLANKVLNISESTGLEESIEDFNMLKLQAESIHQW
jgi:tetratricopeptide (TPR) repeat protein